jgi:hypothetical protein
MVGDRLRGSSCFLLAGDMVGDRLRGSSCFLLAGDVVGNASIDRKNATLSITIIKSKL